MKYHSFIIGQVSMDINIDYDGDRKTPIGGAVVYSGYAASALGHPVAALTKCNPNEVDVQDVFHNATNLTLYRMDTPSSTSIENVYFTADRERRTCRAISRIPTYMPNEIPDVESEIYHLAGLMEGDLDESLIRYCSQRGKVAVDVQGFLRYDDGDEMRFHDWANKKELLPHIHFLKTDAAEAEIMTGLSDRQKAAEILYSWGAKEIMITHNSEVLIYDGNAHYTQPLRPRNLSGRTGRGDTCFSAYITERRDKDINESLRIAAALVSLKMETPQPFQGTREDVEAFWKEQYSR